MPSFGHAHILAPLSGKSLSPPLSFWTRQRPARITVGYVRGAGIPVLSGYSARGRSSFLLEACNLREVSNLGGLDRGLSGTLEAVDAGRFLRDLDAGEVGCLL